LRQGIQLMNFEG